MLKITTEEQYEEILEKIYDLMQVIELCPEEEKELEELSLAAKAYEEIHYPMKDI